MSYCGVVHVVALVVHVVGHYKQAKYISVKKCFLLFSCMDIIMQVPPLKELLRYRSVSLVCHTQKKLFSPPPHSLCSSTASVSSIRVTPRMLGAHSVCTQNMVSLSCSRLR